MNWVSGSLENIPLDSIDTASPSSMVRIMLTHIVFAYQEVYEYFQKRPVSTESFLEGVSKNSTFRKIDMQMLDKVIPQRLC